jgi:O-antigen ligase
MNESYISKSNITVAFENIVLFLIAWEFFFFDNRVLRILPPQIFWPLVACVTILNVRYISKRLWIYLIGIIFALSYAFISAISSPDIAGGIEFVAEVFLYFFAGFYVVEIGNIEKFINYLLTISFIHALLLFVQVTLPNVFYAIQGLTGGSAQVSATRANAVNGIYTGLTGETSTISFYLVIGICVSLYKYSRKRNAAYLILTAIYFVAILLTNRRGNFLCSIVIIILYLILGHEKLSRKVGGILIALIVISIVGIQNIPGLNNMIYKFIILRQRNRVLSGRDEYWRDALLLFNSHKAFGSGLGSFKYFYKMPSAHNSYLQKLGEFGLIGTFIYMLPFISVFIYSIYKTISLRHRDRNDSAFSLSLLFMLLQTHFFLLSLSEGNFETPILYVILFVVQISALKLYDSQKTQVDFYESF